MMDGRTEGSTNHNFCVEPLTSLVECSCVQSCCAHVTFMGPKMESGFQERASHSSR